jgi:endogenous inhibitor of DNA gyrase (YacG/DUF329 family)
MEKQSSKPPIVNCPNCGELVAWEKSSKYRPFCSERCKQLDLGSWATNSYRIPDDEELKDNNDALT